MTATNESLPAKTGGRSLTFREIIGTPAVGPLLALILACIFFSFQSDRFLTGRNLSLIAQQVMVVGTLAIGQTLIILTGGIDLSNGSIMVLGSVLMTKLATDGLLPTPIAIVVGLAVTVIFGALNGILVTRFRLPPFIVTLGTWNIAFALTRIYTVTTISLSDMTPPWHLWLGGTFSIGEETNIMYGTLVTLFLFIFTWFVLRETQIGRHIYAVGDNTEAARLTGINVDRLLVFLYASAGLIYGIAGMLLVARLRVGDPQAAQEANLESITAVVIGGTSLFGGRGSVLGTLIGALIVGVFRNGLQLMGVNSIYQVLITGILVIVAVSVDQLSQRGDN